MTEKTFARALTRGLGSAIVELQSNPNKAGYRDALLGCCLRNIMYDWQCEGTKGFYLYTAICAHGEKDYFEQKIIDRYLSRCPDMLFIQLSSILYYYAKDGSPSAKQAFREKYDYFAAKNGRLTINSRAQIDERLQLDDTAESLFHIDGFPAFKRYLKDVGTAVRKNTNNLNIYYNYFTETAKEVFGEKRVAAYIRKMYDKDPDVKLVVNTVNEGLAARGGSRWEEEIKTYTPDMLFNAAREAANDEFPRAKVIKYRVWFLNHASEAEVAEIADFVLNEQDETVKALVLSVFVSLALKRSRPFPPGIEPLIEYAKSDNALLASVAVQYLENFKDKRLHELAVYLLNTKGLKSEALGLLKKNYRKSDDELILKLIKKPVTLPHFVPSDTADIYKNRHSENAYEILVHAYQKGECAHCRYWVVRAMARCGVLTDEILNECRYDSYDETRTFAARRNQRK